MLNHLCTYILDIYDLWTFVDKIFKRVWAHSFSHGFNSFGLVWFGLLCFYDISTIVGYLMANAFYWFISNIRFLNTFCK